MAFTNATGLAPDTGSEPRRSDRLAGAIGNLKDSARFPRIQPLPHHAGAPRRRAKTAAELADGLEFLSLELRMSRP